MKILLCTAAFDHATTGSGGVARMIAGMEDFSVDVISQDSVEADPRLTPSKILSKVPFLVYYLRSKRYWRIIREKIESTAYDLLLFNDIWLAFSASKYLKDPARKEVVVAFMHDDNTLNSDGARIFSGRWLSYRSRAFFEKAVIKYLDCVLTNSEYLKEMMQHHYPGVRIYRLYYAAMDYNNVRFQPKPINPRELMKVLFIKSDFERGGLKELMSALRSLSGYRFQLTVVGPGRRRLLRKLGSLVNNTDNLKLQLMGEISDQGTIQDLYQTHDLVCVPSHKEALGLVNAEAIASGVPVVSTGVGGIPEVLDNGNGGIIAKSGSSIDIAMAIQECITNGQATAKRVTFGRGFVLERFSLKKMRTNLYSILLEVCNARAHKRLG